MIDLVNKGYNLSVLIPKLNPKQLALLKFAIYRARKDVTPATIYFMSLRETRNCLNEEIGRQKSLIGSNRGHSYHMYKLRQEKKARRNQAVVNISSLNAIKDILNDMVKELNNEQPGISLAQTEAD